MAQTTPPSVTAAPAAPSRSVPSTFATLSDAFLAWMATFASQLVALGSNVYNNAVDCYTNAVAAAASAVAALASQNAAAASAQSAASAAGAIAWVSGTTYAIGDPRWSPITYLIYRRKTAGAGTTDPSADSTNWALAAVGQPQLVPVAGTTQTASVNGNYVLKNAALTTLTFPPTAAAGDSIWVKPTNSRYDNVINFNGLKHEGLSDATMTLDRGNVAQQFIYIDATFGWGIY